MKTNKEGFDTKINKLKQVELFYAALKLLFFFESYINVLIEQALQLDWMTFYY